VLERAHVPHSSSRSRRRPPPLGGDSPVTGSDRGPTHGAQLRWARSGPEVGPVEVSAEIRHAGDMSFRATLPVPPQRTPLTVTGLSILSTVPILVGQLTGTGLDPLLAPISQYVHLPGGYALVLAGAALLAGCGLVLAHHLVQGAATDRGAARRVAVG